MPLLTVKAITDLGYLKWKHLQWHWILLSDGEWSKGTIYAMCWLIKDLVCSLQQPFLLAYLCFIIRTLLMNLLVGAGLQTVHTSKSCGTLKAHWNSFSTDIKIYVIHCPSGPSGFTTLRYHFGPITYYLKTFCHWQEWSLKKGLAVARLFMVGVDDPTGFFQS